MTRDVWYAAYGSNLSHARFTRYLLGGVPPGGRRRYPGASDRTPPGAQRPWTLPWALRFAGASRTWGGGMAFVDRTVAGGTLARLYRIGATQFDDVHAQENAGDADPVDAAGMRPGDSVPAGRGNYPVVVCVGVLDRLPVITFTAARMQHRSAPTPPYVRTIATGLAEAHGLRTAAVVDYLRRSPSIADRYDEATLAGVVAAGVAAAIVAPPRHSAPS